MLQNLGAKRVLELKLNDLEIISFKDFIFLYVGPIKIKLWERRQL